MCALLKESTSRPFSSLQVLAAIVVVTCSNLCVPTVAALVAKLLNNIVVVGLLLLFNTRDFVSWVPQTLDHNVCAVGHH